MLGPIEHCSVESTQFATEGKGDSKQPTRGLPRGLSLPRLTSQLNMSSNVNDILSTALDDAGLGDLINSSEAKPHGTSVISSASSSHSQTIVPTATRIITVSKGSTLGSSLLSKVTNAVNSVNINKSRYIIIKRPDQNIIHNVIHNNNQTTIKVQQHHPQQQQQQLHQQQHQQQLQQQQQQLQLLQQQQQQQQQKAEMETIKEEMLIEEEDDHFQADTYSDYMPMKLKIGQRHPDPVVETSSLSSVHPPDVWYRLNIPEDVIDEGRLSALQLEAITYACQQHEVFLPDGTRAGFLLGDGAGVGKGRTLAGIIFENYLLGRKRAIWLSVSNDLRYDAERDLRDIGAKKINVYPLNKFKYGKISSRDNGGVKKGIIFGTYSSLIGESHMSDKKYRTRLKQLLHWCGEDFDGVIVFDECHKAKNLCPAGSSKPTKTGLTVLELQKNLPKARIIYASATGASEPKNMAYMVRLGLWGQGTPFKEFNDFVTTVEKRGVGAMELVAIDMKLRGVYIARQLSFSGVQFRIEEITLSKKYVRLYDECVDLWVDAKNKIDKALELMEDDSRIKKAVWGQFWAAHQRFFKYLCIAAKVKHAVNLSRDALKSDKCVVIGLQSTGEAKTLELLEESGGELNDFVSTAKAVFQTLIDKHFPAPNRKKTQRLLGRGSGESDLLSTANAPSKLNPVDAILQKYESNDSNGRLSSNAKKGGVWSLSDSEEDDFESVSEGGESSEDDVATDDSDSTGADSSSSGSDIDAMWDDFEIKLASGKRKKKPAKGKDKKVKTAKKPKKKQTNGSKRPAKKHIKRKENFDEMLNTRADFMSEEALDLCEKMKDSLLERVEQLSPRLPPNTLDELIDELGGSDSVAEMTGRKGRVISNEEGNVQYESRTDNDVALEILNVTEKQRFMDDEKQIAIISEAASSGISLHSDRRATNQRRRVHLTIELPWSADRAIQQFGRTHRSNQTSAPEYIFLISDLAGEQRFASIVAKRLESLGALTHGDRRATESRDLSRYNIDNKYGRRALEIVMKSIIELEKPIAPFPDGWVDFLKEARLAFLGVGLVNKDPDSGSYTLEKDYYSISKFLNRLLGIQVELQNAIFKYFSDTLEEVVREAKRLGRYEVGIIDLTCDTAKIDTKNVQTFFYKHPTGVSKIELFEVAVERGLDWDSAVRIAAGSRNPDEGFYLTNSDSEKKATGVFLAVSDSSSKTFSRQVFRIYKPNTGLQSKTETASNLKDESNKKVPKEEAEDHWKRIYEESDNKCTHEIRLGSCSRKNKGGTCDLGLRKRIYHILSGSVLSVWDTIEKVLPTNLQSKIEMARLKKADGSRVIGKWHLSFPYFILTIHLVFSLFIF